MKIISRVLFVAGGLAIGFAGSVHASSTKTHTTSTAAKQLQPSAPRTVEIIDSASPPTIRTGLLQSTLIELPAQEKVATVFGGDTVDWVFDGGHVASRFISVKPKVANTATDIHIVSDHGNEYTLELREVSGDSDPHFDSKVFITPGDQAGKEKLAAMPVFVPAAELDRAKEEAATAETAEANELKAEALKAEQYRSKYPGTLEFDYTWDHSKGKALGLQEVWHDDKFTYLRGQFQETPALYEMKDGKPSLINFDFSNGLYTIPKEVAHGYLTIGKKKVEFNRTGGAN
jgi:type IV secretory pathway VirB9-like protein